MINYTIWAEKPFIIIKQKLFIKLWGVINVYLYFILNLVLAHNFQVFNNNMHT